jgi:hypothetical protein
MLPTPGDVHVNRPLTNLSIAHLQKLENFVATKVFPNIPVDKKSDTYYEYDRGYFNRDEMAARAPGTESVGGGYKVDPSTAYNCIRYSFHHDVPDEVRSNADDPLNPDRESTMLVTLKAAIRREKFWVSKFFSTTIWGTDLTGVAGAPAGGQFQQWDQAASDPIEVIRVNKTNVLESTGFEPNTLVIGRRGWDKVLDHPDLVDRIKYGQTAGGPAIVSPQAVAALLGVERILVMNAIENTGKEGGANVHSFIGGKNALLCYSAPSPGIMTPSAGYTFSWKGFMGASSEGHRIRKFRMEHLDSDRIESDMAFDMKVVSAPLGVFFSGIVA